jgi:ligand-binding sensor domain-containing protein
MLIMRAFIFSIVLTFLSISIYSQDVWTSFDYQTSGTGENGLVGQYVYCFMEHNTTELWIGTASGISVLNNSEWQSYTTNEGLLVNEVKDLVTDNDNNIWIGYGSYWAGVSKFDGNNFTHYSQTNGLVHDKVNRIIKDNDGNIWFATMGGISKFNGSTWESFTYADGLPENDITCIGLDINNNILIGTVEHGLWIYDGADFSAFSWESNSTNYIFDIYTDSAGKIWVESSTGFHTYDGSWGTFSYDHSRLGAVWEMVEDHEGNYFFGGSNGIGLLDGSSWSYFTTEHGLVSNNVLSLYVSSQNHIYCGSEKGVSIFDGQTWKGLTTNGLINNDVSDIFKDNNGVIWFCTHGGISILKNDEWESFSSTPDGENIEWVSKGIQDNNGNYWFTTVNGIYMYDGVDWGIYNGGGWGQDILQDSDNNIWFATWNYLLKFDGETWTQYNESDGFLSEYVEGLYQDANKNIWIGTRAGISKWDGNEFTHYPINDLSFSGTVINSFIEDGNGTLYATTDAGILIFQDDNWILWQDAPGLWYFDSYKDKNDILWFASIDGLYKYDETTFSSFVVEDGLISNIIQGIYREEDTGVFWFATANGVTKLTPDVVAEVSNTKSTNSYSIQINSEGITKPFQFSLDGINFEKNDGTFENLEEGDYNIYVTNAYDTLIINHKLGNPTLIEEVTEDCVNIFPNPSTGKVYFSFEPKNIEIYNLNGSILKKIPELDKENCIDLTEFKNGVYIIQFGDNKQLFRKKVMKVSN